MRMSASIRAGSVASTSRRPSSCCIGAGSTRAAWLVLWQIGLAGDRTLKRFSTGEAYRRVLVEVLARDYPLDHEVIIYRAATLPIHPPRIERCALAALPQADLGMEDTLAIPPGRAMELDQALADRLAALECDAQP